MWYKVVFVLLYMLLVSIETWRHKENLTKTANKIRTNESLIISLTLSKQKKVSKIIKKQPLKYFIIVLRVQRVFKKKSFITYNVLWNMKLFYLKVNKLNLALVTAGYAVKFVWSLKKIIPQFHNFNNFHGRLYVSTHIERMRLFLVNLKTLPESWDSQKHFKILFSFLRLEMTKLLHLEVYNCVKVLLLILEKIQHK